MKKFLKFLPLFLIFGLSVQAGAYTPALSLLTNLVKITAFNSIMTPVDYTNITVATMFGGNAVLSNGFNQTIVSYGKFVWSINVTNNGNSLANFTANIAYSSNRNGGGSWSTRFTGMAGLNNIAPGSWGTVQFMITNVTLASNNAFGSYLVKISNTSAPQSAKAYYGFDGSWYGGRLGLSTNLQRTNTAADPIGPVCFFQYPTSSSNLAGFVKAVIAGPHLVISKSIYNISNPYAGLSLSGNSVIPGSLIAYRIWVTNNGSVAASSVRILDMFSTNFSLVAITNGAVFNKTKTNATPGLVHLSFSNSVDNKLDPGESDVIKVVVKVR